MNSNRKIILYVILGILGICLVLFLLVYLTVIPNPFADNKTLVCTRENVEDTQEYYVEFDWLGNFKKIRAKDYYFFETEEDAKSYYEYLTNIQINASIKDTTVLSITDVSKDSFNKESKKSIKDFYTELGFECK